MAVIDNACSLAIDFAKTLNPNVEISNGINWIWATGFANDDAKRFNSFCINNGCETRGLYPQQDGTVNVRFR